MKTIVILLFSSMVLFSCDTLKNQDISSRPDCTVAVYVKKGDFYIIKTAKTCKQAYNLAKAENFKDIEFDH